MLWRPQGCSLRTGPLSLQLYHLLHQPASRCQNYTLEEPAVVYSMACILLILPVIVYLLKSSIDSLTLPQRALVVTVGFDWSRPANTETFENFAQRPPGRPDVPVKFKCIFKYFGYVFYSLVPSGMHSSSLPYSTAGADLLCQGPTLVPKYAPKTSSNAGVIQLYRSEPDRHS